MTKERAKELLPVITAFIEDRPLQVRLIAKTWQDYDGNGYPDFENPAWQWRVKPKPRKVWINEYPGYGEFSVYKSKREADGMAAQDRIACHEVELPPLP